MGVDWNAVKSEYASSVCTYKEIADKYGVTKRTVERQARRGDWVKAREEYVSECRQRAIEKTAQSYAEFAVSMQREIVEISRKLIEKVKQTLIFDEAFSPRDLKGLSSMLVDLMAVWEKMAGAEDERRSFPSIDSPIFKRLRIDPVFFADPSVSSISIL